MGRTEVAFGLWENGLGNEKLFVLSYLVNSDMENNVLAHGKI